MAFPVLRLTLRIGTIVLSYLTIIHSLLLHAANKSYQEAATILANLYDTM